MARTAKKEEQPVFDYTHYSRQQQKATTRLTIRLQNLAQRLEDYTQWEDEEAFEDGLDQFDEMQEEIERTITKWVVDVPRSWLVADAPETVDWTDPKSINLVRADKFSDLSTAAAEARSPERVSGNSAKR